jgi:hypothetical protein
MYFKRGRSYFWKVNPNFIRKSNIINKTRCILNVGVFFWKLKPNFIKISNIINKITCILNAGVLISEI